MPGFWRTVVVSLLTCLTAALLPATAGALPWEWQNPLPQGNALGDVTFISRTEALAIGDAGTMVRSVDGGRSWTPVATGVSGTLFGLCLGKSGEGWAVGAGGVVLRTDDAGHTWRLLTSGTNQTLTDIALPGANMAVAVGEHGLILRSADGGRTWSRRPTGTTHNLLAVTFVGKGRGYAVGDLGTLLYTGDKGRTWQTRGQSVFGSLHDVLAVDKDVVLVAASLGSVWRGTGKGFKWQRVRAAGSSALYGLAGTGDGRTVAVGENGALLVSADTGKTWRLRRQPGASLFAVSFSADGTGLSVGANGRILRTRDGVTWTRVGSGLTLPLRDVEVRERSAWAVGDAGTMLARRQGQPWRQVSVPVVTRLTAVSFADDVHGCAVGEAGTVVTSYDGGASWRSIAAPTSQDLLDVDLAPAGRGWAVGAGGTVLRSADWGASWSLAYENQDVSVSAVLMVGAADALAVGGDEWGQAPAVALRSQGGGVRWQAVELDIWGALEDLAICAPQTVCAVGVDYGPDGDYPSGVIVRSSDGGVTWQRVYTTDERLFAIAFADELHGWAAGAEGMLLATADGGQTWWPLASPTTAATHGLACGDAGRLWAVGGGGAILFAADREALPAAPAASRGLTLLDLAD